MGLYSDSATNLDFGPKDSSLIFILVSCALFPSFGFVTQKSAK